MYNGSNCDRQLQLSEILTEPLNPRAFIGYKQTDKQSIYRYKYI